MGRGGWLMPAVMALLVLPAWGEGEPAPPPAGPPGKPLALPPGGVAPLAAALRGVILQTLPDPLYEDLRHWGKQRWVVRGVEWKGQGLRIRPEVQRQPRNDGRWWKIRVSADRPAQTLVLDLRDLQQHEAGRVSFVAGLALDARVEFDRQTWRAGTRLYSSTVRARFRLKLGLRCEAVTRLETGGKLLPEAVFRLRVLHADLRYDHFVVEHAAGVGGDLAKVIGETARGAVRLVRPSLERRLLERANAAILKAGDTREVRIGLLKLVGRP